jgi:hypothetical protein
MIAEPAISGNLQVFIDELHKRLASCKIDRLSADELKELKKFVLEYGFEKADWKEFVFFDDRTYTRNLLDGGNGIFDLLLLGWCPGQFRYRNLQIRIASNTRLALCMIMPDHTASCGYWRASLRRSSMSHQVP